MPRSVDMETLLLRVLIAVPPPGSTTLEALIRNRALQQALSVKAMEAAETRWPGFERLVNALVQQEQALQGQDEVSA